MIRQRGTSRLQRHLPLATPVNPVPESPEKIAMRKAALMQAVSQLDMLLTMFSDAPEKVQKAAKAFRDALEEWSNGSESGPPGNS
jgi:hypothetical protein